MKLKDPLLLVLIGQLVVLAGAAGFLAARPSPPPHHAKSQPAEVEEIEGEGPEPLPELKGKAPKSAAHGEEKKEHGDAKADHEEKHDEKHEEHADAQGAASDAGVKSEEHGEGKGEGEGHAAEGEGSSFEQVVADLVSGNARFAEGALRQRDLLARRESLAGAERADAVIVTCTDSRIVPELLFDQPLGSFAVVRTPGAQVDAATARAVEESARRLHAKTVLVLGHVGCHHVAQALSKAPKKKSARAASLSVALGGLAAGLEGEALDEAATVTSLTFATHELRRSSRFLSGHEAPAVLRVLYSPVTGQVRWLDAEEPEAPAPAAEAPRHGRR